MCMCACVWPASAHANEASFIELSVSIYDPLTRNKRHTFPPTSGGNNGAGRGDDGKGRLEVGHVATQWGD